MRHATARVWALCWAALEILWPASGLAGPSSHQELPAQRSDGAAGGTGPTVRVAVPHGIPVASRLASTRYPAGALGSAASKLLKAEDEPACETGDVAAPGRARRTQDPPLGSRQRPRSGAGDPDPSADATQDCSPQTPIPAGEKRTRPDYDGRGEAGRASALWAPRILLSPLWFTSEFIVRRPLGALVTTAEKHKWPSRIIKIFSFGTQRQVALVPTALVDFGFRSSVGALFLANDLGRYDDSIRARVAWGGPDWLLLSLRQFREVTPDQELGARVGFWRRPDQIFHGLGPRTQRAPARYLEERIEGGLEYRARLWRTSSVRAEVGLRDSEFDPATTCCHDPSVAEEVGRGRFPPPEGMGRGYTAWESELAAALDTRPRRHLDQRQRASDFYPPPGSGVRVGGTLRQGAGLTSIAGSPVDSPSRYGWVGYAAVLGAFLDLTGMQRAVGLEILADFVDPVFPDGQVPFPELVTLGGERSMRGFREGRLRGRSAAVARFEYSWPIWFWLDGSVHYDLGSVFGAHLQGFDAGLLRQSVAVGIKTTNARDYPFEVLVGVGTRTLDEGSGLDTFRLVIGARNGL